MMVLELFSGTASFSKVAKEHGHEVFTVDNDISFHPSLVEDIRELRPRYLPRRPDVIWASPPCEHFSVASIGSNWIDDYRPKTWATCEAMDLVWHTRLLISYLRPKYWFIENPVGVLRSLWFMRDLPRRTVTYCQYGDMRRKPTDIWTNCNNWYSRPMCKNGDPCHEAAARGSKTGTQGLKDPKERARVPTELCEEILDACEMRTKVDLF